MFLPKRLPSVTSQKLRATLSLNLDTNSDLLNCGNVMCNSNGLYSSPSFEKVDFPVKALKVVAEYNDRLYVLGEDGLYSCHDGETTKIINKPYYDGSCCVYQKSLIFSGSKYGTYIINGDTVRQQPNVCAVSMAVCGDRQIGLGAENVIFITPIGFTEWVDAFHILPQTKVNAVIALGRKMYALGDTCYVIDPNVANDYEVTYRSISQGSGVAQEETQATFGKKAVFATDCGLRLLQSDNVTPIFAELNDFVSFVGSVACSHNGLYYVSCKRKCGVAEQNDITLVLDIHKEKIVGIFDMGLEKLCSSNGNLYATRGGEVLKLSDTPFQSYWVKTVDFNSSDKKFLDALVVKTKQDIEFTIQSETEKRAYKVAGKDVIQRIPVAGAGRSFAVTVYAQDGMLVQYAELVAHKNGV